MTTNQRELIRSTVPILKTGGKILIEHFYKRMLTSNPELKNIFNMAHQASGRQQEALTGALLAYAEHIDDPTVLIHALKSIGNKHVSLNITSQQYDIVGEHLIASIKEVLGDLATLEVIDAWTKAYVELAQTMIEIEREMYESNSIKKGAWKGWRTFVISKRVQESQDIMSFYLIPQDGNDLAKFLPGQYITIKMFIPELGYEQPRQYSLSSTCNKEYYRISVKKVEGLEGNPDGLVSYELYKKKEGDTLEVSSPAGVFYANPEDKNPLVLISGGVGVTPLMSILETTIQSSQKSQIIWLHGCRNKKVHAFKKEIEDMKTKTDRLVPFIFYETVSDDETTAIPGRIDLHKYRDRILLNGAKYYICGPDSFITKHCQTLIEFGVEKKDIFFEEFGPRIVDFN